MRDAVETYMCMVVGEHRSGNVYTYESCAHTRIYFGIAGGGTAAGRDVARSARHRAHKRGNTFRTTDMCVYIGTWDRRANMRVYVSDCAMHLDIAYMVAWGLICIYVRVGTVAHISPECTGAYPSCGRTPTCIYTFICDDECMYARGGAFVARICPGIFGVDLRRSRLEARFPTPGPRAGEPPSDAYHTYHTLHLSRVPARCRRTSRTDYSCCTGRCLVGRGGGRGGEPAERASFP